MMNSRVSAHVPVGKIRETLDADHQSTWRLAANQSGSREPRKKEGAQYLF
jgi:hypothetical protein